MYHSASINDVIQLAFAERSWLPKEMRMQIESHFSSELISVFDAILKDSCWPAEPWTKSKSLPEAARKVEPILKAKYPELSDESVNKVMNYACFQWK